jgi:hypothetical protein
MWKRCTDLYEAKKQIIERVWFEAWRPLIPAFLWGMVVWWYQGKSLLDSFSAGFTAFFFIFFLQGQVLRVKKNVDDQQNASEFRSNFASLQEGLNLLQQQSRHEHASDHVHTSLPSDETFLFLQARRSIDAGQYFTAAVTASVGFEYAIRNMDRPWNKWVLGPAYRSILINTLQDSTKMRLKTLIEMRKYFIHPNHGALNLSKRHAEIVVNAFEEGAYEMIESIQNRKQTTTTD